MTREEYLKTHTKETPEKYCAYCGKRMERRKYRVKHEDLAVFIKRKYCCRECMRKAFIKEGKDMGQTYRLSHSTAERIAYTIMGKEKKCELCGSVQNIDVHHKDGDPNNNTRENLMVVCRSCHMKLHHPKGVCQICGAPMKAHGYCYKHYQRFKKYGDPLISWGKRVDD